MGNITILNGEDLKNSIMKVRLTGPNLVLIEGGTFAMGLTQEDATYEWNNIPRRVTVSSFYMDETEVANIDYREYLHWLQKSI